MCFYQTKVSNWYTKFKPVLKKITEDISDFLLPESVNTPHLKVMLKTHKPNCPVRLTFSSVGSVTRPLSTVLDHVYLKPAIKAGSCTRRLGDTRETLLFIEEVNDFLWSQSIENKPNIFSLDVVNFFPSVLQDLALPAITKVLENRNIKKAEAKAVSEGLKVVRDGNFFKRQNEFYNQISGCALGDPGSCSYTAQWLLCWMK